MGIYGLKKEIKSIGKSIQISTLAGETIYVDISIWMHKFLHTVEDLDEMLKLFDIQARSLLKNGIIPVYVFDGNPDPNVKIVTEKRINLKTKQLKRLDDIDEALSTVTDEGAINALIVSKLSLENSTKDMPKDIKTRCKELLTNLGVSYRQALYEADTLIAELLITEGGYGVLSEDVDMLTYQCPRLLTDLNWRTNTVIEFVFEEVLALFKMDIPTFVDYCILCGCDYAGKIKFIGNAKAKEWIKRCKTIESLLVFLKSTPQLSKRHTYEDNFLEQVKIARNMFLRRSPTGKPIPLEGPKVSTLIETPHDTIEIIVTSPSGSNVTTEIIVCNKEESIKKDFIEIVSEPQISTEDPTESRLDKLINATENYLASLPKSDLTSLKFEEPTLDEVIENIERTVASFDKKIVSPSVADDPILKNIAPSTDNKNPITNPTELSGSNSQDVITIISSNGESRIILCDK